MYSWPENTSAAWHGTQTHVQVVVAVARAAVEKSADAAVDDRVAREERLDFARVESRRAAAAVVSAEFGSVGRLRASRVHSVSFLVRPQDGVHDVPRGVARHVHDPQLRFAYSDDVVPARVVVVLVRGEDRDESQFQAVAQVLDAVRVRGVNRRALARRVIHQHVRVVVC